MKNKIKPITINIQISLGQPCIRGTDIQTHIVAERFAAGASLRELAKEYGFGLHKIEAALRFELGSPTQRSELVEIVDAGPVLADGIWHSLDLKTLQWH